MQRYAYAKNTKRRRLRFGFLAVLYVLVSLGISKSVSYYQLDDSNIEPSFDENGFIGRKLLSTNSSQGSSNKTEKPRCNEPSIKEFPKDVFTQKQRRYGAVLLHLFMALYMFIALAFVCDDYFISALDKICQRLDLSEDVAGATFMAAGSSAPEFFTSMIGVFITKGDVGVGTIVGSAVFNILVIIALCAVFAGQVVHLTWWPLCRDSAFYTLSVAALIWTIHDGSVTWWESLIMIIFYVLYIVLMKFNPWIVSKIDRRKKRSDPENDDVGSPDKASKPDISDGNEDALKMPSVRYLDGGKNGSYIDLELVEPRRNRMTWKELGMMIMLTDKFSPSTRFRAACLVVILRGDHKNEMFRGSKEKLIKEHNDNYRSVSKSGDGNGSGEGNENEESMEGTAFLYPQGSIIRIVFWIMSLPLVTILYFTIPDCRKVSWEAWYLVTFFMSIFWICIFSYVMVWMVCVIGFTLGIPDVIMGLVFLAAGTSIPDAISSLLVAREGLGDMAVSNSIGSNVFDILIGLAVPWFIRTSMVSPGSTVHLNSRGMIFSVGLLFASVLFTVLVIHLNKWKLDKKLGIIFFLVYLVFVTLSSCIEFNVFGFVNYPVCEFLG